MKPLLILMRIAFVGVFWSVFFLEGIRVIMLRNWHFDIVRTSHWQYAWDLWLSGWVIDDTKEWAFILIILTFIPLWLTGWAALSMIKWEKGLIWLLKLPAELIRRYFFQSVKIIAKGTGVKAVKRKKSYKEVRPKSLRAPMDERIYDSKSSAGKTVPAPILSTPPAPAKTEPAKEPAKFDHSLFKFDEDDDFDFDFDAFDDKPKEKEPAPEPAPARIAPAKESPVKSNKKDKNKKPQSGKTSAPQTQTQAPAAQRQGSSNSTLDVLRQKGYEVITGVTIKNNLIDFVGVAENQICICLIDKEPGDWLADEERFNDEEPLWFSESSHRISPVRKVDISRQILIEKLNAADMKYDVRAFVIEQIGNIINAEDMFEIWDDMDINVTRIDRGTPKELKLFSKTLEDAFEKINSDKLEKVKKIIRSIA